MTIANDTVEIREAERKDAQAWAMMRAELWAEADPTELAAEVDRHFSGARVAAAVFVADVGDAPSAFLELSLRSIAEGCISSPIPYVEAWYVRPAIQRRGIGRRLMKAAEVWAHKHGYLEIASDTTLSNEAGDAAHRHMGFIEVERAIHFRKSLAAVPPNP